MYRSKRKELAPIGFFIDFFPPETFHSPILPIPMRIDKVISGKPTLLVIPDEDILREKCKKLGIQLDINKFFSAGLNNLIAYARKKCKEQKNTYIHIENIKLWYLNTKKINFKIPELQNLFTKILSDFLEIYYRLYAKISSNFMEKETNLLIDYYDSLLEFIDNKIMKNQFQINQNEFVEFYKTRKGKLYPEALKKEIIINDSIKTYYFVPYLIYDDIFECIEFNKQNLIKQNVNLSNSFKQLNKIINKGLSIIKINQYGSYMNFSFEQLDQLVNFYED
jgi:hypothetical protein